ncbi:MAG: sulfate ABC transporter permease subunit CysW [Gemmataceae bacterium]|nr:sulfate ABC transporter permease subunit CysW [Gemmataceae bacterium]
MAAVPTRQIVRQDPWYVRVPLILFAVVFLAVMVVGPLVNVFAQGLALGVGVVWQALSHPDARHALMLTLIAAACAVAANVLFGLAAAWSIARFRFPGKALLNSLIDLPFSVSPVIAGLIFVLLFGAYGFVGPLVFGSTRIDIIFALPGILLATTFVTVPFIARELIPVMEALGPEEEEAARILGANAWQMFRHVTLPNIKWGLLYGVLLCNARAIGEFGAVNVVSGKLAGRTDTLPLHIEKLYQGFGAVQTASAFALASILCCLALATLLLKNYLEWKTHEQLREAAKNGTSTDSR